MNKTHYSSFVKFLIPVFVFVALTCAAPQAKASWLSKKIDKVVDSGKKFVNKVVDEVKPIINKGNQLVDKIVTPIVDFAKSSGGWRELLGLLGGILGGGGTAGGADTGGGDGDGGAVGVAAFRGAAPNHIESLTVVQAIKDTSLKNQGGFAHFNTVGVDGTTANSVKSDQLIQVGEIQLQKDSVLDLNNFYLRDVKAKTIASRQVARGGVWRLESEAQAGINQLNLLGGQYGNLDFEQVADLPRMEIQKGGATMLNQIRGSR